MNSAPPVNIFCKVLFPLQNPAVFSRSSKMLPWSTSLFHWWYSLLESKTLYFRGSELYHLVEESLDETRVWPFSSGCRGQGADLPLWFEASLLGSLNFNFWVCKMRNWTNSQVLTLWKSWVSLHISQELWTLSILKINIS